MKHNQKGSAHYILIVALVAVAVAVVALYITKMNQQPTITNDGFTYSFVFNDSKAENANGIAGLTSKDGHMSISMWPSKENQQLACSAKTPKIKDVTINGRSYGLCQASSSLYLTSFNENNQWHNVLAVSPDSSTLNIDTVSTAIERITVTAE